MGMYGGYRLFQASDIQPHLPALLTEIQAWIQQQGFNWYPELRQVSPEAATFAHIVEFLGTTASAYHQGFPFCVPVLRLSYGDGIPEEQMDLVMDFLGRCGIQEIMSEETWT